MGYAGPSPNFGPYDYGNIPTSRTDLAAGVRLPDDSVQPIARPGDSTVGQVVCSSSRPSGVRCGSVTEVDVVVGSPTKDPRAPVVTMYGQIEASFASKGGDSGGAVFAGSTALGINSAVTGPSLTTYQPVRPALAAYSASLLGQGGIIGLAGKCIDVEGNNAENSTPVILYDCNGQPNQKWEFNAADGSIRSLGKCLDVEREHTGNNSKVILYDCKGSDNQKWTEYSDQTIRNPVSGRCLDARGAKSDNGTQLIIYDCNGQTNQAWYVGM